MAHNPIVKKYELPKDELEKLIRSLPAEIRDELLADLDRRFVTRAECESTREGNRDLCDERHAALERAVVWISRLVCGCYGLIAAIIGFWVTYELVAGSGR